MAHIIYHVAYMVFNTRTSENINQFENRIKISVFALKFSVIFAF